LACGTYQLSDSDSSKQEISQTNENEGKDEFSKVDTPKKRLGRLLLYKVNKDEDDHKVKL
jgi:hypothetical protein